MRNCKIKKLWELVSHEQKISKAMKNEGSDNDENELMYYSVIT